MSEVEKIVFVAAKRTPFGAFGGGLATLSATDLALHASEACLKQSGLSAEKIDAVIVGNVVQSAADAIYLARHVALKIGVPEDKPALIVNRLCGSGFEAIVQGAYQLRQEGARCVLVGGSESMTQIPYVLRSARFGQRLGHSEVEDYMTASLTDAYTGMPMAITAENLAEDHKLSREVVDAHALTSQLRAAAAWENGSFSDEVSSVNVKVKRKDVEITRDEHFRPQSTAEGLAKLPPLFKKDGVVTAGNASGICDGASMLLMCTESFAKENKLEVLGSLTTWASVGCDPTRMGIGPVPATHKALERWSELEGSKKTVEDFDLVEINEAFASQFLAVQKQLKLNIDKTNLCGGAIALGHPLAASGARLVTHLLYQLAKKDLRYGLASACIGGGQGMSVIVDVK